MIDEDVFLSVLEHNMGILYKVANSYCKNADDRKDLIQEMILQLWKSFGKYNSQYKHSTWIYRIALNVAISFYRKGSATRSTTMPINTSDIGFQSMEMAEDKEQQIQALQQFITELKALDKALMLLYLEEKSYKEIAEIIGISQTNVATKIGRIKKRLKQKFLQAEIK